MNARVLLVVAALVLCMFVGVSDAAAPGGGPGGHPGGGPGGHPGGGSPGWHPGSPGGHPGGGYPGGIHYGGHPGGFYYGGYPGRVYYGGIYYGGVYDDAFYPIPPPPVVVVRQPVVVTSPVIVSNPPSNPPPVISANIQVVNPAATGVTLSYLLDGQQASLRTGMTQQLSQASVIQFDRGNGLETARYTLTDGVYRFIAATDGGWDLVRN